VTERFRKAMEEPPPFSNADDPSADRLAAHDDAGELGTPQDLTGTGATGPVPPQPAGTDTEVIFTGASGRPIGGPAATDPPGQAPGMPGPDGAPPEDGPAEDAGGGGPFVDRLDR
jgi:hypothetical protein